MEEEQMEEREKDYGIMLIRLEGMLDSESDWLANLANASALLYRSIEDINWAGFYLYKRGELVLGPFQGKRACTRIKMGSGVCGTAAATGETQLVKDVHNFPGHIACDKASNSEVAVPIEAAGKLVGGLDIDSPLPERFGELDAKYLLKFTKKLAMHIDWSSVC